MSYRNDQQENIFLACLENAKTVYTLSEAISCEGLKQELRYLASWISLHVRKCRERDSSRRYKVDSLKQACYLSREILRCLSFAHESGYLLTSPYRELDESYRWINAQISQWEQKTVADRWLGRIIRIYHGENTKKGGMKHENNDRFSFDGSDGLDEFSRICANRIRY